MLRRLSAFSSTPGVSSTGTCLFPEPAWPWLTWTSSLLAPASRQRQARAKVRTEPVVEACTALERDTEAAEESTAVAVAVEANRTGY